MLEFSILCMLAGFASGFYTARHWDELTQE